MSLIGRFLIDKVKTKLPRLTLPVPPYGDKNYWEMVYKSLSVNDVYEWGDLTMKDLKIVKYKKIYQEEIQQIYGNVLLPHHHHDGSAKNSTQTSNDLTDRSSNHTTMIVKEDFSTAIRVPRISDCNNDNNASPSILILGCGNSNLGEEIYHYYNHPLPSHDQKNDTANTTIVTSTENDETGLLHQVQDATNNNVHNHTKILQCDVSPSAVNSMSQRYSRLPHMSFYLLDFCSRHAIQSKTQMKNNNDTKDNNGQKLFSSIQSTIPSSSMDAVIDKGLVDALFCSDKRQIPKVMMNAHQCLKDNSVFIFFSFSRPEYLFKETLVHKDNLWDDVKEKHDIAGARNSSGHALNGLWSEVDVCQMDKIFMYKFVKGLDRNGHQAHHPDDIQKRWKKKKSIRPTR
mmetsp:Transcript_6901/g.13004  ORF Transcript_6901/g.13004 Transcript_6901/m.13004 type:complete len:400 (+) Transcript_6901:319-1518(+)